jgi:hypothetical protein
MHYFQSILWQIFCIYLIYKLARLLTKNEIVAVSAELIFFFYFPMNSGAMSFIANRYTLVSAVFYLLAVISFFQLRTSATGNIKWRPLLTLFFVLSLFSKEMSVTFILTMGLIDLLYFSGQFNVIRSVDYIIIILIMAIRFYLNVVLGVVSPFSAQSGPYQWIMGFNIMNNLAYYTAWLLLPAVFIITSLCLLSIINKLDIEWKKAFPWEVSIFGLIFALINISIYLPFAGYRQLGWLFLSTIGMAIFLASPTCYFLALLSSKRNTRKSIIFAAVISVIFFISMGTTFFPEKIIKRGVQAGYSRKFINDFIKLNIGSEKKVYVVDIGTNNFRLADNFIAPMVKQDVLYEAVSLFIGKKTPKEVHLVDKAGDAGKGEADKIVLYYKNGKLFRY